MIIGIIWAVLAAVLLGFYALPSKFIKDYEVENIWGVFWLLAMFLVPFMAAVVFVEGLADTYAQVSVGLFVSILALSLLWGAGNLLWGISISRIGMALGFSLLIGVTTFVGSILPFFMGHIEKLGTAGGMWIIAGIFIIMIGIVANGKAGLLREKHEQSLQQNEQNDEPKDMRIGIIMCVVGGLCAAGFNLSYHVADSIAHIGVISQEQFGNPPWVARLAVMLPSFIGSGIATVGYFAFQLSKKKAWANYSRSESPRNILLILIMSVVYCASLIIYGYGAYKLGALGTSVGFAIFQSGCIMVANLLGILTGEWKDAGSQSRKWLYGGLSIMLVGILIIAFGNSLLF